LRACVTLTSERTNNVDRESRKHLGRHRNLKARISEAKISRLCLSFGRGQDRAADAALPERYASASAGYGGAAFVPRKAKHVRFLQRSAFF
jgi:hypothetical protein